MHGTDIEALRNPPKDSARTETRAVVQVTRSERREMNARGVVEGRLLPRQDMTILNLSCTGCLVRTTGDLMPGDKVFVLLPAIGGRRATVRRIVNGCYGCAFEHHLHPSELEAAFFVAPAEDVQAIRRRIRETIALNDTGEPAAPEGRGARIMSGLRRIVGSRSGE